MCLKKLFKKIKKIVLKKNLISKINEKIKKLFSKIVQYQINPTCEENYNPLLVICSLTLEPTGNNSTISFTRGYVP